MISELPFKSTIPELGKIIDGIEKAGEKILEVYETDFSTEKKDDDCLLYTSPSPRDGLLSRMPSSA